MTPNGTGEGPEGMAGLGAAEGMKGAEKDRGGSAGLLVAEPGGIGGENGSWGYWPIGIWPLMPGTGEMDGAGAGGSLADPTPRARSFASFNSST